MPFRLLKKNKSKSVGDSENLIIEGDNLEALKALLPHYQNKIKCIYIDPPYNTGNEGWVYNDNVDSPIIKKWLGKVVGESVEDLEHHDKWLCMMYPRLKLLKELLSETGVIFVSINAIEEHHLRNICDEIFGESNFIEKIVWNKRIPKNDKGIGNIHEYFLAYVKESTIRHEFKMPKEGISEVYSFVETLKKKKIPIDEAEKLLKKFYEKKGYDRGITLYCNLDENYKIWGKINVSWPNSKDGPRYGVIHPKTKKLSSVPNNGWRYKEETMNNLLNYKKIIERYDHSFICGQMWFAKDEKTQPSYIQYLDNVKDFLLRSIISIKSSGGSELDKILPGHGFPHPKPYQLIKIFLETIKEDDFIILDSFAGSGTTAQAVLELNKEDGGNRKFILVELESEICKNTTSQRVKKVIKGYEDVSGTGGGFQYAVLDKKLFNADGRINDECTFEELASYLYFTETKTILDTKKINKTLLDTHNETQIHLMFDGVGKNNLDRKFLSTLDKNKDKIIYADKCTLDNSTLEKHKTLFKQIPYEVKEF